MKNEWQGKQVLVLGMGDTGVSSIRWLAAPLRLGFLIEAEEEHQRTFNVARPISTSTTLMIQKRTITRGSGQPFNSK